MQPAGPSRLHSSLVTAACRFCRSLTMAVDSTRSYPRHMWMRNLGNVSPGPPNQFPASQCLPVAESRGGTGFLSDSEARSHSRAGPGVCPLQTPDAPAAAHTALKNHSSHTCPLSVALSQSLQTAAYLLSACFQPYFL